MLRFGRLGIGLHAKIVWSPGHAVLVRATVDCRLMPAKIVMRGRGRYRPLQRSRLPGVLRGLWTLENAIDQIGKENDLGSSRKEGRIRSEPGQRPHALKILQPLPGKFIPVQRVS